MSTPLPPVPNVLKAVLEGTTSFARNWLTIFHFLYSGTVPNAAALQALANDIYATFTSEFAPLAPPTTSFTAATVTDLSTVMTPSGTHSATTPGSSTADKLPANCATLYNWDVAMRYKGGHPRNYVYVGTDENLLNESEWNSAYLTTAETAMSQFISGVVGTTVTGTVVGNPVMVSYFGGAPTIGGKSQRRAVPLVLPLAFSIVNPIVGSQRRRLGRRS